MAFASVRRAVATATVFVGSCRLTVLATAPGIAAGALAPAIAVALGVVPAGNVAPLFPAAEPPPTEPGEPGELDEPEPLDEPVPLDDEPVPGNGVEPLPDPAAASAELIVD